MPNGKVDLNQHGAEGNPSSEPANAERTATQKACRRIDSAHEAWALGDPGQEEELFEAFRSLAAIAVWMFYGRDDEDLVQTIVCNGFLGLRAFEAKSRVSTWFYSIARNECTKALREVSRQRKTISITSLTQSSNDHDSEDQPARDIEDTRVRPEAIHSSADVRNLVKDLPDEQRRVIVMNLEGHSLEEIAKTEGEPLGTIRGRFRLAKDRMRSKVKLSERSTNGESGTANDIKCVELDLIEKESPAQAVPAEPLSSYQLISEEPEDEYPVDTSDPTTASRLSA